MFRYQNNCFYPHALQKRYESAGTWPSDGVDVDDAVFEKYGATPPDGHVLGTDEHGQPCWVANSGTDSAANIARAARDEAITSSMWLVERHRGQDAIGVETSITPEQFVSLLTYHQTLRNWPAHPGWPDIDMPPPPIWLPAILK